MLACLGSLLDNGQIQPGFEPGKIPFSPQGVKKDIP
jgi:hypothetical protein